MSMKIALTQLSIRSDLEQITRIIALDARGPLPTTDGRWEVRLAVEIDCKCAMLALISDSRADAQREHNHYAIWGVPLAERVVGPTEIN